MGKKFLTSIVVVLGVVGAATLLPDFTRYTKIRAM
jgi:hypothetical protein